eukprot:TRINITY_DN4094_c0_g5_i1.p1 TRINITY_DN4094_c0_g5~~TRINITY_DN4094_c0_g5_i1.p1  ORF type:complete len:719 (+),score=121.50 TRINITY_DN4094_c0_g5_i1:1-2157(+)
MQTFLQKDQLIRTRPAKTIGSTSGGSRSICVRAWWQHAYEGVRFICKIPKSTFIAQELKRMTAKREMYIALFLEQLRAKEGNISAPELEEQLSHTQMGLTMKEIMDWRMLAQARKLERESKAAQKQKEEEEGVEEEDPGEDSPPEQTTQDRGMPGTLQAKVKFQGFAAYFLAAQSAFALPENQVRAGLDSGNKQPQVALQKLLSTRQLIVNAEVSNVVVEAIQKGHSKFRTARWVELSISSISVLNCNTRLQQAGRQIMSIKSFAKQNGQPVCVFVGATTYEAKDRSFEMGDTPLSAVLQPWEGLLGAQRTGSLTPNVASLQRLGFLKDQCDDINKLMIFMFARVGQIRASDYSPFRQQLLGMLKQGKTALASDLVRRPSEPTLNRELLIKLQKKVQAATGKSNMLGIFEGVIEGVKARTIDPYNSLNVLCKEADLAPLRWKVQRSGNPQAVHLQFYTLNRQDGWQPTSLGMLSGGTGLSLLPWQAAMMLLPKGEFDVVHPTPKRRTAPRLNVATSATSDLDKASPQVSDRGSGDGASFELDKQKTELNVISRGSYFLKWGRNGKPKKRWVMYDELLDAIVWKDSDSSKNPSGLLQILKIQDICTSEMTPILKRVASPKLDMDLLVSVVTADRTLDLQADSKDKQLKWADALKAAYRKSVSQNGEVLRGLPRDLERKQKSYPKQFRSGLCDLRVACDKLQAVNSLGKTLQVGNVAGAH